ncbi:hypothetical protein OIU84_025403 [Salix udensis]|uniref:Uncharacterized protein n=1 Tax=Salix udensis TaxID=889485 RepID=A0AAD6PCM1_9ROSI|nr:hypothetical protein OIU84_025403 [Salix udensis]
MELMGDTSVMGRLKKLSSLALSGPDVTQEKSSHPSLNDLLIQQDVSILQATEKLENLCDVTATGGSVSVSNVIALNLFKSHVLTVSFLVSSFLFAEVSLLRCCRGFNQRLAAVSYTSVFDFCAGRCRHNSESVVVVY